MHLGGKIIIVTGAANGMGRELTKQLVVENATVIAVDINQAELEKTVELCQGKPGKVIPFNVDIAHEHSVNSFIEEAIATTGHIDVLINNAGIIQPFKKVAESDLATLRKVFDVNFFGSLHLILATLPHLILRPKAQIVNVSSMGALVPVPGQVIYGASKAAVKLMTEGLMSELSNTNISVTQIIPGAVATDIMRNSGLENAETNDTDQAENSEFQPLPVETAASLIIKGIVAEQPRVLIGKDVKFLDMFSRISPLRAARFINNKMQSLLK